MTEHSSIKRTLSPILLGLGLMHAAAASAQQPAATPAPAPAPAPQPAATPAPQPAATPTPQPAATPAPVPAAAPAVTPAAAPAPTPAAEPAAPPPAEPTPAVPAPAPVELPASAPEPVADAGIGLKPIVSMMTRFETRHHYDQVNRNGGRWRNGDRTAYRARFGLQTTPISIGGDSKVVATVVPQSSGFIDTSGGVVDPGFNMHEGYIKLTNGDTRLDVGRFEMIYGDHLVIGNLGWHQTARSFDAVRLHAAPGDSGAWVDVFVAQVREGMSFAAPMAPAPGITAGFGGDEYFMGIYADLGKLMSESMNFDTYLLAQLQPTYTIAGDTEMERGSRYTLGVRVKNAAGDLDYRIEAGAQLGAEAVMTGADSIDRQAFQADAEVGYKFGKARIGVEGFFASGDDASTTDVDEGWNELYPTTHKWLGLSDVMGVRTNVLGAAGHFAMGLSPEWKLALDCHAFSRPHGSTDDEGGYAGTEVDGGLIYAFGKGSKARAMYAVFAPGDFYADDPDPVHYLEVELSFNFK